MVRGVTTPEIESMYGPEVAICRPRDLRVIGVGDAGNRVTFRETDGDGRASCSRTLWGICELL